MPSSSNAKSTASVNLWFAISLVFAMALPMLILYTVSTLGPMIIHDLKLNSSQLGLVITGSFASAAFFSIFSGIWVNRLGSKKGLVLLFFTVFIAFVLLTTLPGFLGIVIAVIICGVSQSLANPVTNLLIAEHVQPHQKASIVGIKQAGVQLSALIAGLLLPGLAVAFGWRNAVAFVIPIALLFLLTAPLVAKKQHTPKRQQHHLPNSLLCQLMSIQLTAGLCLSAFVTYLPSFAVQLEMPITTAGSLIAAFGVAGMMSRVILTPLAGKLSDESTLLLLLLIITACAIAVLPFSIKGQHGLLWISAIGVGLSAVGTNAIAMSMLIRDNQFGPITSSSSWVSVAFFSGFAIGPALFGHLFTLNTLKSWWGLIFILIIGIILTISLHHSRSRRLATY